MKNFLFDRQDVFGEIRSPVLISNEAICRKSRALTTLRKVIEVCRKLSPDKFTAAMVDAYRAGADRYGDDWQYADITTLLYSVAELGQPENYLEIGVRRGRSACMVAAASPATSIFAFDLWQPGYAASDNPGPDFVASELRRVGHTGNLKFVSGDSHQTVPKFVADHPSLRFDLITVDGDHTLVGASDDLANVVSLLKVGGVIVFDDIDNPYCPGLDGVWAKFLQQYPELNGSILPNALGLGVGFAIRLWPSGQRPRNNRQKGFWAWLKR
ncbi:MAG: class I SAM-dependent methyltransferase [Lysobacterales bacterium]